MSKKHSILFFFLFSILIITGQENKKTYKLSTLNDGPFVFIEQDKLIQKEIINGEVLSKDLPLSTFKTTFTPEASTYTNVKKVAALSDIHGQYDLAVTLLKNNKVIDKKLNWKFGKGHLVIAGDIFDRGDKVHETLLLVYKLDQQAKKQGGRVHFLLGNHEYMVLHSDLRYIHEKYTHTSDILKVRYDELYGKNTVLGRWIRAKATIIKINDNYFVHGGVSKEFIKKTGFSSETMHSINTTMRTSIERSKEEMKSTDFYKTYYSSKGLIWYRGYFNDNLEDTEINDILHSVNAKHIIVGHCSNKEVVQLFNHKIYGVDSSLKNGKYGELLLIKNEKYERKTLEGKTKNFSK